MKKLFFLWLLSGFLLANEKLIIAHRGASGYLPEHSLESKVLAHAMNVPYIEQDLVMSKDDELVVIHDIYLDNVSDVAQKFPNRARKDGHFYVVDFTLKELRELKMSEVFDRKNGLKTQRYPKRFPMEKSDFRIHTFEEEIELIQGLNQVFNKEIGLYVEVKKPWFHKQEGKDISKKTLEVLKKYHFTSKKDKVYFQSFDYPDLVRVKTELLPKMNMDIKLIALIAHNDWDETFELKDKKWQAFDFSELIEAKNYATIANFIDGVGPSYDMLFDKQSKKGKIITTKLVKQAHKNGLEVHAYTIRAENLPPFVKTLDELFEAVLFKANANGVFTDFPDKGLEFLKKRKAR